MLGETLKVEESKKIPQLMRKVRDLEVKNRLTFLNLFSRGMLPFEECCDVFGIATSTGYSWIKKWNLAGLEGITDGENKGGRPPRLSDKDLEALKNSLKERDHWTTRDVVELIQQKFGVTYSYDQVSKILKKRFG